MSAHPQRRPQQPAPTAGGGVWVRRDEAALGGLPARCARTDQRCISRYPRRISRVPALLEWATWTDLWPLAADPHPGADPVVVLPVLPGRQRLHRALTLVRDVSAAVLVVGLLAMAGLDGGLPDAFARLAAITALVAKVVALVAGFALTVHLTADRTGEWVHLARVTPAFAEAVRRTTSRPERTPVPADPVLPWRARVDPEPAADG